MTNYKPLLYGLGIIFIIGISLILLNPLIDIDINTPNPDSILTSMSVYNIIINWVGAGFVGLIETGWSILGFNIKIPVINPFALFGESAKIYIQEQIILFSYIPDLIAIPLMILIAFSFIWSIVKIVIP